jgi:hypothetical protein
MGNDDRDQMKGAIQKVIKNLMERVMDRVLRTDPFITEIHRLNRPLYSALVPDEIFKGSHFERRFVTPFGSVWEQLAIVAAQQGLGYGVKGYRINGLVRLGRLQRIQEVLNKLEHSNLGEKKPKPDWKTELDYICEAKGELVPTFVECDVFVADKKTERKYAFELKSPLPNSDITKVSKEKLFKLHCMEPMQVTAAYFCLAV